MRTTHDHALVGLIFFDAATTTRVPLLDPEADGNLGLQGYNEFFTGERFETAEDARAYVEGFKPITGDVQSATVTQVTYDEERYDDREFGDVADGIMREVTEQYGYPDDSGVWTWDDPEASN
jgi:hypothetical protein